MIDKYFLLTGLVIVTFVLYFVARRGSSEERRIREYLMVYWELKKRLTLSERQILEEVAAVHIKSGKAPPSVKSGKQYLDGVFSKNDINIIELIEHFIWFEFPRKYKPLEWKSEDLYEMERRIRSGRKSAKELLAERIKKMSNDIDERTRGAD